MLASLAIFVALLCFGTVVASSNCTAVRSEAMGIASRAAQGFEASACCVLMPAILEESVMEWKKDWFISPPL